MPVESYKEDKRPSQQWYWDDWFSAFDARLCSLAARGLWIDMLGIMWKAEIRGTLTVNGKQIDNKTLATIIGEPVSEIKPLLRELESNNVFSRLDDGTIICRRMFRESGRKDHISNIRSKAGKEGAKKRWQKIAKMATSTSSPSSTPSPKNKKKKINKKESKKFTEEEIKTFEKEFEILWENYHPDGKKNKQYAKKRFIALCKQGKLEDFKKGYVGYANFLRHKELNENFEQRPKYFSTLCTDYEEYIGFKYEPRL